MYALMVDAETKSQARVLIDSLAGVPRIGSPAAHTGHLCLAFDYAGAAALAIRLLMRSGVGSFALGIDTSVADTSLPAEARNAPCLEVPCVRRAQKAVGRRRPIAVECPAHPKRALDVEDALMLVGVVLARRTSKQWLVANLLEQGLNGQEVADELGITKQAVSRHRAASNVDAEHAGWELLVRLLERCADD